MKIYVLSFTILSLLLISCQQSKTENTLDDKPFVISNAWLRPGVKNRNTAAFLKITNNTNIEDTLFDINSDLSKVVELHETYNMGNDLKGMRHIKELIIPVKSVIELKPGSFYIMLIGLNKNIRQGENGWITLKFRITGEVKIPIKVRDE